MKCRHCKKELTHTFVDLGFAPHSNAYLSEEDLFKVEKYYPLKVKVCNHCWLVQNEDYVNAGELFNSNYAYFSSTSSSWLAHSKDYSQKIIKKLELNSNSYVVEIASNDGYLLKNFVESGIPCLGIEPTDSTAAFAENLNIPVLREFFTENLGEKLSAEGKQADLIVGNNVYAHVPDINDFTRGLKSLLKTGGTVTIEFPHLMRLVEFNQFDTVYHEHFSYLSLQTVEKIFTSVGLRIWHVEELPTHGSSLRVYGCHSDDDRHTLDSVKNLIELENIQGLQTLEKYLSFQSNANSIKDNLVEFLIAQKRAKKKICGYGAAAKGSTLLNFAGIKVDLLPFICDAAPSKQGMFMPGSHIPIVHPSYLKSRELDTILILPWNIVDEVLLQNKELVERGVKFVTAVPEIRII